MKHSGFVFGLASLVAACAAQPRQPLCNGDGSPACGNIGQVGRPTVTHAVIGVSVEVVRDARPDTTEHLFVTRPAVRTPKPLLAPAPATQQLTDQVQRPILNLVDDDPMGGNVMSKGGGRRHRSLR